jgi:hypothetical protein
VSAHDPMLLRRAATAVRLAHAAGHGRPLPGAVPERLASAVLDVVAEAQAEHAPPPPEHEPGDLAHDFTRRRWLAERERGLGPADHPLTRFARVWGGGGEEMST